MPTPPPPLVLIHGDEGLLVDRAVADIVARARRVEPEVERREAAAAGMDSGDFAELTAPSLFAEPRLVILRDTQDAAKPLADELVEYTRNPVDGVTLVVHHSGGARNKAVADAMRRAKAEAHEAPKVTKAAQRVEFALRELKRAGGTTTGDAAAALVDAVGSDLRELATAASQLVADTGGLVDESAVRRYHRGRAEVKGFAVADKVMAGDLAGALEALRWASAVGEPLVLVADALADGVRTVAKVRAARPGNSYAMAGELGMPAWKIDKARGTARGWSEAALTRATALVAALNADVKGQAVDPDYATERAVIDLVRARRLT